MITKNELDFNRNEDALKMRLSKLNSELYKVYEGGGKKNAEKQHARGKMLARERVDYLLDTNTPRFEVGALAANGMYSEIGGCPSAGVVVVIGYVSGRQCIVVANDATVKAGAWFPMTAKKNLRAQEISIENRLPIIYLVDSAGVYLPLQDEIFPDKEHFGRIFRNNAVMSSMGIIQIAAIMGSCVAGGAYLPIMSDEAMIVDKTGSIFLAGSYLVKAAIGENIDNETLGGATTQCEISGVTDNKFSSDAECLDYIKNIMGKTGQVAKAGFDRIEARKPKFEPESVYGIIPDEREKPYDIRDILNRILDDSALDEYKPLYGKSLVCGFGRIEGWAVGIVANQRKIVKAKTGEMQIGGVIYSDSADKAARFVMNCNQRKIPILFLQDVTGFMVGSRAEHGGIIKDGAKLVNAVANSVVPKFTVIIGNSYGAGNYAMCGKAYDPRLIVAWPTAQIAVMGGAQAAKTLLQIQVSNDKSENKKQDPDSEKKLLQKITDRYNAQLVPEYAASRLWVDAIIDPAKTREFVSMGIEASNHAPLTKAFNPGIIQT